MIIVGYIVLILYFNFVRFLELNNLTNVYSFKDYMKYGDGLTWVFNVMFFILALMFYVLDQLI